MAVMELGTEMPCVVANWLRGVAGVNGPEAQLHMRRMRFVGGRE